MFRPVPRRKPIPTSGAEVSPAICHGHHYDAATPPPPSGPASSNPPPPPEEPEVGIPSTPAAQGPCPRLGVDGEHQPFVPLDVRVCEGGLRPGVF